MIMTGIASVMKFNVRKVQNGYIVKEPGLRGREWITTDPMELLSKFYEIANFGVETKENRTMSSFSVDKTGKTFIVSINDGYVELMFSADTFQELRQITKGHI